MLTLLKKEIGLNKAFFLNLLSTILLQGIAFLTIPIFSRILGSSQFGLYGIFNSWVSIISIIISLGIGSCIGSGKFFFKEEYYNFRNNIVIFNTIISIFIIMLFILLYNQIKLILSYNFVLYIVLLLTAFSTNTIGLITGILIFEKKVLLNFTLSVFLSTTNVLLSLYLIYNFSFTNIYEGRVYGHFLPYFLVALFLIIYIVETKHFKINCKYLKYGLIVGGPVLFHQLSSSILSQSDRVIMQKMLINVSDIGIYSLFYSFTGVLSTILSTLNNSFVPFYYEYIDKNDKESIIEKSKNLIEFFTIICIVFLLLSREVSYFIANREYHSGINLIPIFVNSIYFNFMYLFSVNYEFFHRKTNTIAIGTIGAAIINIVLNYKLIKCFGLYGAAYATIISYCALFIFHYVIAKNMIKNKFYIHIKYYILGLSFMILFSYLFYALSSKVLIRLTICVMIGTIELYRIFKRKALF